MSSPLDWTTPEGIEAHINEVWAKSFGYQPPGERVEREGEDELTPGDATAAEPTSIRMSCDHLAIEFTQCQGTDAEEAQDFRIEFSTEGSAELVVEFGPARD